MRLQLLNGMHTFYCARTSFVCGVWLWLPLLKFDAQSARILWHKPQQVNKSTSREVIASNMNSNNSLSIWKKRRYNRPTPAFSSSYWNRAKMFRFIRANARGLFDICTSMWSDPSTELVISFDIEQVKTQVIQCRKLSSLKSRTCNTNYETSSTKSRITSNTEPKLFDVLFHQRNSLFFRWALVRNQKRKQHQPGTCINTH